MNSNLSKGRGEGERLHAQRRKRFWLLLGGLALIGFAIGFVAGFGGAAHEGGNPPPMWIALAAVIAGAALAAYGSWKFFVSVDEVELMDNLWGSLIGFYAYALLFPAWWALNELQVTPPPDAWTIYTVSLAVATLAYFYRKYSAR